ncbi:MAG: NnrU family protein [Acidobacteriota bacterium]|jgi:methanethiol S-methyltransferase
MLWVMMEAATIWAVWCVVHSLLAAAWFKRLLEQRLGTRYGFYRLAYNVFSVITVVPVAYLQWSLKGPAVLVWRGPWIAAAVLINVAATVLFVAGARAFDLADFLGFRGAGAALRGVPWREDGGMQEYGILRWMRHPWYAGAILVLWGHNLDAAGIAASAALTAYLLVGAWLEERKLLVVFGHAYREYRRRVPAFYPRRPR